MVWVRRFLALLLIAVFVPALAMTAAVLRVNGTVLEPEFWIAHLRKADVYNYAQDAVLPAALDQTLGQVNDSLPVDVLPLQDRLKDAAREILPPEWIQTQVETALLAVPPYVLGDADSFELHVEFKDRVQAATDVLRRAIEDDETFRSVYVQVVDLGVRQLKPGLDNLPFAVPVTDQELRSDVERIVPEDWLQAQLAASIESVTPYLTGDQDGFTVMVPLEERVHVVGSVLKELLARAETQAFIVETVVVPMVVADLGGGDIEVAPGVVIAREDVSLALRDVMTDRWVADVQGELIDSLVAYLTGDAPTLSVEIDLASRKDAASASLADALVDRLEARYDALPVCTVTDVAAGRALPSADDVLPDCRIFGMTFAATMEAVGFQPETVVSNLIGALLPDRMALDEPQLRALLGPDAVSYLDKARAWTRDGVSFTDQALVSRLDPAQAQQLDQVRALINEGVTFTDDELRAQLAQAGTQGGQDVLPQFDLAREYLGTARRFAPLAWAVLAVFAAVIGLLGGRNWGSRLGWTAVVLGIAGGLLWAVTGPVYQTLARPRIEQALDGLMSAAGETSVEALVLARVRLLAENATDDILGGLELQALVLAGMAAVLLALGIALQVRMRRAQAHAHKDALDGRAAADKKPLAASS